MLKKKLKVVELNKKKEKIVLEQEQSNLVLFWKKYNKLIFIVLLILSLAILGTSILVSIFNLSISSQPIIKNVSVDTDLGDVSIVLDSSSIITDDTAKNTFNNTGIFKSSGEALFVKKVEAGRYTILYYSDYTAVMIMKDGSNIVRINSIDGSSYGISSAGFIDSRAYTSNISLIKMVNYSFGDVYYYSDGSAIIMNSKMDMFVRNSRDINELYISNNKVSYLKESKKIGKYSLSYYLDGSIMISYGNNKYIVRNSDDINISGDNIIFPNYNQASIYKTLNLDDGKKIEYYTDGGAIIYDGSRTISVRKSNSIIIKNNLIYEIVDNKYVTVSKKDNNITYYTNGSAIINNYNGKKIYVSDNSMIKYRDNILYEVVGEYENLSDERNIGNDKVSKFESVSVIEGRDYIAIVPSDNVIYDSDGSLKEILDNIIDTGNNSFKVVNNTNKKIKYRLVIEKSNKTNLDLQYVRYQISVSDNYFEPARLDLKKWNNDNIFTGLSVKGDNYILLERELESMDVDYIKVMFWIDYDNISNEMQDKYFYGTLKLYSWEEISKDNI